MNNVLLVNANARRLRKLHNLLFIWHIRILLVLVRSSRFALCSVWGVRSGIIAQHLHPYDNDKVSASPWIWCSAVSHSNIFNDTIIPSENCLIYHILVCFSLLFRMITFVLSFCCRSNNMLCLRLFSVIVINECGCYQRTFHIQLEYRVNVKSEYLHLQE